MDILKRFFSIIFSGASTNKGLRILLEVNTIFVFVIGLFAPFYAIFVVKLGVDISFAGFSWGLFMIVAGVLTLLFSKWNLKIKEQELLIALGYALRGIVFLSYAFMNSIPQLLITQVFWGVAMALGSPAFDTTYSKNTSKENSIAEWGQYEGISAIATGLAALVGGILIRSFGYPILFSIMSVISFGLGIYIWRLPREVL